MAEEGEAVPPAPEAEPPAPEAAPPAPDAAPPAPEAAPPAPEAAPEESGKDRPSELYEIPEEGDVWDEEREERARPMDIDELLRYHMMGEGMAGEYAREMDQALYDRLNMEMTYGEQSEGEAGVETWEAELLAGEGASDVSIISEPKHPLDILNDQQLITLIHDMEIELKHINLENQIFQSFLQDNDPAEMEGLDNLVNFAVEKILNKSCTSISKFNIPIKADGPRPSALSTRRSLRHGSFASLSSMFEGKGPKINLSTKSDMALKAMEEIQASLEVFVRKTHRIRRNLRAELEEFGFREKDIKESIESFEFNVLIQGVDRLTQRIPAEKFLRWMEEWLKCAQLNIEKLRLRTASLRIHLEKVSATLVQRRELRENVHAVDFDQLEIENKHFAEKLEQKNVQLIELKRMSGGASLVLNNNKKDLRKLQDEYNNLKAEVAEKEKAIDEIEQECDKIEGELEEAKEKYYNFKKLTKSYKVPEVMEYVNIKSQLTDIRNQMKVWYRRKKIQDITINACLRQMKNITGSPKIDRSWLDSIPVEETIESIDSEFDHSDSEEGQEEAEEEEEREGTITTDADTK